jgi:hypothetical protein
MSEKKTTSFGKPSFEQQIIEERKLKALEKIANSLDALALWFEEVDKEEWSERIQYYLSEFHRLVPPKPEVVEEDGDKEKS